MSENMYSDYGVIKDLAYGNSKSRVEFSVENFIIDFVDKAKLELCKKPEGIFIYIILLKIEIIIIFMFDVFINNRIYNYS